MRYALCSRMFGASINSKQGAFAFYKLFAYLPTIPTYKREEKKRKKTEKRSHHFNRMHLIVHHLFYQDPGHLNRVLPIRRWKQDINEQQADKIAIQQ